MADLAISYAHFDKAEALALRDALAAQGVSVWMDTPRDEDAAGAGIPVGQAHWEVIEREFAAALVIVVLDTPKWRLRDYCQKEYRRCRELGKPLVFVVPGEAASRESEIAGMSRQNRDALAAHARLAARAVDPEVHSPSWYERLSAKRLSADARAVLAEQEASFVVTPLIREIAEDDLATANAVRRRFRRVATGAVAGFTVAAVAASVGWGLSERWSQAAAASRDRAEALELTAQSQAKTDTVQAIRLAEQARSLDDGAFTAEVLAEALLRDQRMRVIEVPADSYRGAVWSADEEIVYLFTADSVTRVDAESGVADTPVSVGGTVRNGTMVADSSLGVAFVDTSGALLRVAPGTQYAERLDTGLSTIALGADGTLLGAGLDGELFPITVSGDTATRARELQLPNRVRSVDVAGDVVAVIDDEGWARRLRLEGGGLVETAAVRVAEGSLASSGSWLRSNITVCGDELVGSFVPGLLGVAFGWNPDAGAPEVVRTTQVSPPVCAGDGAWVADLVRGDIRELQGDYEVKLSSDVIQVRSVRDPRHDRVAFVSSQPGRLLILDPATAISQRKIGPVTAVIPLDRTTLQIGDDGEVADMATGRALGRLPAPPSMWARQGCDAMVASLGGLAHVSCDGSLSIVADADDLAGLRSGADGRHFVVTRHDRIDIHDGDGSLVGQVELSLPGSDSPIEADLSPDGQQLVVATVLGSVFEVAVDGGEPAAPFAKVPAGNYTLVAYLPGQTGVVVTGVDGRVRRYDEDGSLVASRQLDLQAQTLTVEGDTVLLSAPNEGSVILEAETLAVVERIAVGEVLPRADVEDDRLALIIYGDATSGVSEAALLTIPNVSARPAEPADPSPTATPTTAPGDPEAGLETLGFDGLGPFKLGATVDELQRLNAIVEGYCGWDTSEALIEKGVSLEVYDTLVAISLLSGSTITTGDGARVGMSTAEVVALYGDRVVTEVKFGNGGEFDAGVVRQGDLELVFTPWDMSLGLDPVAVITLREYSEDMFGGC